MAVAQVARAVAARVPKVRQVALAMALPHPVAEAPPKAHAVIAKIVPTEVWKAPLPIVSTSEMIATTTVAMTVAPVATNCRVTLTP